MATHSSVRAWTIPGSVEPGGLPSMGSHRVGHDWSDLAAAAADYHQSWANLLLYFSCYCCSVSQSYLTLCQHTGFPCPSLSPEFTQTHDHWFSDAIQPSHSLSPTSALNLSQHQGFSSESAPCMRWPKNWNFSISPSNVYLELISFKIDWFDLLAFQGTLKGLL